MEDKIEKRYYDNGNPRYEWHSLNGNWHGIQIKWYENGNMESHGIQLNNHWNNIYQYFNRNKTRYDIEHWKDDQRNGPQIQFNYKNENRRQGELQNNVLEEWENKFHL